MIVGYLGILAYRARALRTSRRRARICILAGRVSSKLRHRKIVNKYIYELCSKLKCAAFKRGVGRRSIPFALEREEKHRFDRFLAFIQENHRAHGNNALLRLITRRLFFSFFFIPSGITLATLHLRIPVSSPRHAIARFIIDLALLDARLTRSAHPADPLPSLGHLGSYITRRRAHSPGRINPGATTSGD